MPRRNCVAEEITVESSSTSELATSLHFPFATFALKKLRALLHPRSAFIAIVASRAIRSHNILLPSLVCVAPLKTQCPKFLGGCLFLIHLSNRHLWNNIAEEWLEMRTAVPATTSQLDRRLTKLTLYRLTRIIFDSYRLRISTISKSGCWIYRFP